MSDAEQSNNSDSSSDSSNHEVPTSEEATGKHKRDNDSNMGTHKRKKINDIKELVEYLVVVGNDHRHKNWRRREHSKRDLSVDNLPLPSREESQKSPQTSEETPDRNARSILLNVQDYLVYGQKGRRGASDFITFWPNPPKWSDSGRIEMVSDHQWEDYWGDEINPIAFSNLRLSATSHELLDESGNPRKDELHPSHAGRSIDTSEAARSILLKCWHRAIHAASQITVLDTQTLSDEREMADQQTIGGDTGFGAARASPLSGNMDPKATAPLATNMTKNSTGNDPDESVSSSSGPSELLSDDAVHRTLDQNKVGANTPVSVASAFQQDRSSAQSDTETYGPDFTRTMSQNLGIGLAPASEYDNTFSCPVCQVQTDSFARLESHYYGESNVRSCSWIRIQKQKEKIINESLQAEVLLQARQLAEVVAMRSVESIKRLRDPHGHATEPAYKTDDFFRPAFDWNHVHNIFVNMSASARLQDYSNNTLRERAGGVLASLACDHQSVANALDSTSTALPLLMNRFIIETTTNRLHERNTRVPK